MSHLPPRPEPTRSGPLTTQLCEVLDAFVDATSDGELRDRVAATAAGLREPLRVAVAGRIKAGKSTLVNALLGQRVAATDVGECTRVVSWFRFGTQECVDIHRRDGQVTRMSLEVDGSLPESLGVDVEDISHLDVWVSNDALRAVTVIDTPGLASSNDEYSAATRQLLALDSASRGAVAQADVLLLVLALDATSDDGATLEAFSNQFGGLRHSAVNTLTVLTRIDQLGSADQDPLAAASDVARRCADQLRMGSSAVVPVIGLLAETTACGRLTEQDREALGVLAALPAADVDRALVSTRRFVSADLPVAPARRARLLEILDLYGLETLIALLRTAPMTSAEMVEALRTRSGIANLDRRLWEDLATEADTHKAVWALGALDRIAHDPELPAPERGSLRDQLEEISLEPTMNRVLLVRAIEALHTSDLELPPELRDDLLRSASGSAPPLDRAAAAAGAARWRTFSNSSRASPMQRDAAEAMCRHYELVWEQLGG